MSDLLGCYIDHQMAPPLAIAQLSAEVKPLASGLGRSGILLFATCARVEVYGEEAELRHVVSTIFSDFSFRRIEGVTAITRRVAELASGAHSQILGESYISQQLTKAIEFVSSAFPILQVARSGINTGRAVRKRRRFIASLNYDQIVRDIIGSRFTSGEPADRLYIVGGGMLGRGLISSGVGEPFRSTVVVTRNPKNLRKRLRRQTDVEVALMRPADMGSAREPRSIVVIATADLNDEYEATLQDALLRLEPRTVVDLSSIPVLSGAVLGKLNCVSTYDEEFVRFIEQNNRELAPKLPLVLSDIEASVRAT
ncbi:hypothetical protein [Bradyrhizobium sp. WSM1253]|uniref:hypothetical protein n=1 Tax=Bradyrhizobium sp. WSM1253 TaxID=319003 RepID=UPI00025D269F|nr:hypothetical protein [Bradyrhizobium sp. WSM1253]EIG61165.1 glutamyl-tRNA reductase [Bradyrhizobium sp. WSM1253]